MIKTILFPFFLMTFLAAPVFADSEEDEMAAMQRQLNSEVMAQGFDPGDLAKLDAYMADALKKDIKPVAKPPSYWRPGYTCNNIYSYGYRAWRNCRYYHRYYGRYW